MPDKYNKIDMERSVLWKAFGIGAITCNMRNSTCPPKCKPQTQVDCVCKFMYSSDVHKFECPYCHSTHSTIESMQDHQKDCEYNPDMHGCQTCHVNFNGPCTHRGKTWRIKCAYWSDNR